MARAKTNIPFTPEKLLREMFARLSPACRHRGQRRDYIGRDRILHDTCKKLSVDNDLCTVETCPLLTTRAQPGGEKQG